MADVTIDAEVLQGMTNFISGAQPILEKTATVDAELSKMAPSVVDTLIKAGLATEDKKEAALAAAKDPVKVLEMLHKTAALLVTPAVPSLGQGETQKKASFLPEEVGVRVSKARAELDARYVAAMTNRG